MGRYQKPKSSPQDLSKLPERPTKKASTSIRRGDRRCNEDIVEEVDKDTVEESDNASEDSSEDNRDDASDKDTVEEVDKDIVEDDNSEEEFDEESSDEDNEDNLGVADVGRDSSSEKGKKEVEASEIPGQPINPRLLSYYKDHIARSVWENENPRENPIPLLKLHQHQDMVKTKWPIDKECVEVQEYVKKRGLYSLIKYGHDMIDRALINTFRERWYPKTNTYHMPFGEMTITIKDVERITRLNAKGKVVEGVFGAKNMTWDYTNDSKKRKGQCARAYLLYIIGSIVCGDKSGSRVNAYFLQCLENLEEVNSYSWAIACLAWIYHHLGQGSRTEVYSMAGCMTIVQAWIYDHFPVLERHSLVGGYEECNPKASLYVPIQPERTLELYLVDLREKLDDLTE
ncbi:hypothetical protein MKX03_034323 [Papaver bracteatum]|nr:hypothetical protein MKX03_034323 [Papaver bracteatum]